VLIGEWPILKLKIRYRNTQFNYDFLDMVWPHEHAWLVRGTKISFHFSL
jgi:hypothetical protein